jgi:ribokinase
MSTILIIGGVNLDRVWRLGSPLRSGRRHIYTSCETRIGGGGFNTGVALRTLGHEVALATTLADDPNRQICPDTLKSRGFIADQVHVSQNPIVPVEIFVDPLGERTIVTNTAAEVDRLGNFHLGNADLVYVNARRVDSKLLKEFGSRVPIVAQFPLHPDERRPAHIIIGSASDFDFACDQDLFRLARRVAGGAVQALILTGGSSAVQIWERTGRTLLPVAPLQPLDSTGAGDVFAAGVIDALIGGASVLQCAQRGEQLAHEFLSRRFV